MQPLIEVQQGQLMQSGIYPSLAPNQRALWRDATNVLFHDGRAEKLRGWSVITTFSESVNALAQAQVEGEERIYAGSSTKLNLYRSGLAQVLGSGYSSGRWSMDTWGDWLLATNDIDPVQVWKNSGPGNAAALAGTDFVRAKIVRKLANHVLCYNTSVGGQMAHWSSISNPEDWAATETNSAGNFFIRDLDGDIEAAEPLGRDVIAFYTQNSMGFTQYVGAPFYFTHKVRLVGIGAVGRNAVADVNGKHYGVSRSGLWMTDGFTYEYVDDPAVNRWLDDNVDWTKGEEVCVVSDTARRAVNFWFTCKDNVRRALSLRYAPDPAWTKLEAPVTAVAPRSVYDQTLVAVGAVLARWDLGNNAGAEPLPASLRSAFFNGESRSRVKLWDMLQIDRDYIGPMEVRFGFSEVPTDSEVEWTAWQPLATENWIGRESAHLCFEIRSNALGSRWALNGFNVFGELTGYVQ